MAELSPAAQAVLDAAAKAVLAHPRLNLEHIAAAALCAAADQVVPKENEPIEPPGYGSGREPPGYVADWTRWSIRRDLLAIAAELEAL
jgi:hypothetical protein